MDMDIEIVEPITLNKIKRHSRWVSVIHRVRRKRESERRPSASKQIAAPTGVSSLAARLRRLPRLSGRHLPTGYAFSNLCRVFIFFENRLEACCVCMDLLPVFLVGNLWI